MIHHRLVILLLLSTPGLAAFAGASPADHPVGTVESYELDARFMPAEGRMEGTATIALEPLPADLTSLTFYLHGELVVASVSEGRRLLDFEQTPVPLPADYSMAGLKVLVHLPEEGFSGKLTVKYGGLFTPSQARSRSDYMRIDATGVYLRSIGYSPWFPVFSEPENYDARASFPRVVLRTPAGFIAIFVGERVRESSSGEEWLSEWRARDIPLFAAQCTARRFSAHRQGSSFLYAQEDERSRLSAPKIADFARQLTDLYHEHYRRTAIPGQIHIVQMPPFGDISSGNVVGISTENWLAFAEDEGSQRTLAHELVHPFVQVPTPPGDPLRAMVIEGFPSFFHLPMLAELHGNEIAYDQLLDRIMAAYLDKRATGKDRRGRDLPPEKPLVAISEQEIGLYKDNFVLSDRALLFLDYLRRTMGKDEFMRWCRRLLDLETLSLNTFYEEVLARLPEARDDLRLWLETSEYPHRFHRPRPPYPRRES